MKSKLTVLLLSIILLTGGCLPATQEEVQVLKTDVDKLLEGIDGLQGLTTKLVENDLVSKEKVDRINAEIDKVQEHTATIAKEVATAEDIPGALKKGIEASRPFNPYADEMNALLGVALVIGGWMTKKKIVTTTKEKQAIETKYSAAKIGMDTFKNTNPDKASELYNAVSAARKAKNIA